MFWRKKKETNPTDTPAPLEEKPATEPSTDCESTLPADITNELVVAEDMVLEDVKSIPAPQHTPLADAQEAEELRDHTADDGWLSRLVSGLSKSTHKLTHGISDLLTKRRLDKDTLQDLEDVLITADLGPATASRIVAELAAHKMDRDVDDAEVKAFLAERIESILKPYERNLVIDAKKPCVILMTGVNGVGKTTTIGKMAEQFRAMGKHVMLAAADTFRAAAVEQLQVWGHRAHAAVVTKDIGADPASVAFEALEKAARENTDVLLIDTAGRLHNKANLMAELEKITRVLKKHDDTAPHQVLLVLDATTGQNAIDQAKAFKEVANITGLVITKLDGSAKGGVVVALADQLNLPIVAVGVGEQIEDLQPFNATAFARALVGLE